MLNVTPPFFFVCINKLKLEVKKQNKTKEKHRCPVPIDGETRVEKRNEAEREMRNEIAVLMRVKRVVLPCLRLTRESRGRSRRGRAGMGWIARENETRPSFAQSPFRRVS